MDKCALNKWRMKERADAKAGEHFRENCLRDLANAIDRGDVAVGQAVIDLDDDDDDIGESYMEWLSKDLERQKKEQKIEVQKRDAEVALQKRERG